MTIDNNKYKNIYVYYPFTTRNGLIAFATNLDTNIGIGVSTPAAKKFKISTIVLFMNKPRHVYDLHH